MFPFRPFVPPINPNNPFEDIPMKFRNFKSNEIKRHSLPDLHNSENKKNNNRRRSSGDIRSVVELFSNRRNLGVLEPVKQSRKQSLRRSSISLSSLQSYGHLKTAHMLEKHALPRRSSNLTLVCVKDNLNEVQPAAPSRVSRLSTMSFEDVLEIRDKLYTPLSNADKGNIVADSIPYNRILTSSLASLDLDDDFAWLNTTRQKREGGGETSNAVETFSLSSTEII